MDYSSSLELCYPKFKLEIMDAHSVELTVRGMKSYREYTHRTQELIDAIALAENYKYRMISKIFELHGEKEIEVVIETTKNK